MMKKVLFTLLVVVITSCKHDVDISVMKVQEDGIITYVVENPTDIDINYLELGFTYLDENGDVIKTDTVWYKMDAESPEKIFLKAHDQTWVSQRPPEGTEKSEPFIVKYE